MSTLVIGFDIDTVSEEQLARVRALAPDMEVLVTQDARAIEAVLGDVEIVAGDFPHEFLPRASSLRWLQQWGAGADWLMRCPEAVELPFVLTNVSGVHAVPISEHIMAFLLAFARRLPAAVRSQDVCKWSGHDELGGVFELAGKTMVLIGMGAIGSRTARLAAALEMRVLGVRRHPAVGAPFVTAMYGPDQLLDILPKADFVVLAVPLTHETKGMIGERQLGLTKRTAYLVNIGRGGTVQEDALVRALREGWIAGAGLDVFGKEPLPAESPLWGMERVLMTFHYSGATPHYNERAMAIFLDNLRRYRAGEPLRNVVDKRLGY